MRHKISKRVAFRRAMRQLRRESNDPLFSLALSAQLFPELLTELWDEFESIGVSGSSFSETLQAWIAWMIENKEEILELILFLKELYG